MKLKCLPEDFIVDEVPDRSWSDAGDFLIVKVTKKNRNTEDVAREMIRLLNIKRNRLGYAGTKDKVAVTSQFFSLKNVAKERVVALKLRDVVLEVVGCSDEPLFLGALSGNAFKIVVRDLGSGIPVSKNNLIPNFFDEQRFGSCNDEVGESLVKKDFRQACEIIMKSGANELFEQAVAKGNFIEALHTIPKKILMLYVHAFQSRMFNAMLDELLGQLSVDELCDKKLPLIGFGTDIPEDAVVETVYREVLEDEGVTERDFVIRQLPEISAEGSFRPAVVAVNDLVIGDELDDELHAGKKMRVFSFSLPKGAYATNVVKYLSQSE